MFGDKKNLQSQVAQNPHIHTMQQDLSSPSFISSSSPAEKIDSGSINTAAEKISAPKTESISVGKTPIPQAPSPFLADMPSQTLSQQQTNQEKARQIQAEPPRQPIKFTDNYAAKQPSSSFINEQIIINDEKTKKPRAKLLLLFFILCIIIAAAAGGYYFLKNKALQKNISSENNAPANEIVAITPALEKYSTQQPNYLKVDMSNASPEQIRATLKGVLLDIEKTPSTTLLEFIITDANNNPVSFPIFAIAAGINFSNETKANLEESFSLFVFNDNNNIRLGLSLRPKNKALALTQMLSQENHLIENLTPLYLGETISTPKNSFFKDSSYNNIKIRYLNIAQEKALSLDYAFNEESLLIATSRDSLRAIIDKISTQQTMSSTTVEAN